MLARELKYFSSKFFNCNQLLQLFPLKEIAMRRKRANRISGGGSGESTKVSKNGTESTTVIASEKKATSKTPAQRKLDEFMSSKQSNLVMNSQESNKEVMPKTSRKAKKVIEAEGLDDKKQINEAGITKEVQIQLKRHEDPGNSSSGDESASEVTKSVPKQAGKSGKRKRGKKDEDEAKPAKSAKKEKVSDKSKSTKEKIPDVTSLDFSNDSKSPSGNPWNLKIASWNVNGIRAWLEKNGLSFLHHEKPDILCIQETKCSDDKLPEEIKKIEGYHVYWLSGDKEGYSGVGIISKPEPLKVEYGIGVSEHDNEGRVITAEYEKFFLVAAYVPNAGRGLVRLDYRQKWDTDFLAYLKKLDSEKTVILCGDLNVAHEEIDLANPKTNKKNAGFTKEEREGFSTLLSEGFTDSFRHLYPDVKGAYTFWTYMMNARAKNVGWRLDYFVISERLSGNLCDSVIRKDVMGSDHCPITLFLSI